MVAKSFRTLIAAGALASLSTLAYASPIMPGDLVEVSNQAGGAFTPSPVAGDANGLYTNLTFRLDAGLATETDKAVAAGLFVLDQRAHGTADEWEEFYSFCLQPDVWLMPFSNPYEAATVADSGYNTDLSELWGRSYASVANDLTAAAFQVAVWELAYDGDNSLDTGIFQLVSQGAVYDLASQWLAALDGTGPTADNLLVLSNDPTQADRQDLLTARVPEPANLALLLLGFGALAARQKRG